MFKPEYAKVKFISEWMGCPVDSVMTILKEKAEELQKRGTVKIVPLVEPHTEQKSIDEPPMHKMVTAPPVKKSPGRPKKIK